MTLRSRLESKKHLVAVAARGVEVAEGFDLGLPVGVLLNDRVVATTLAGLRSYLLASAALSSPEIERFLLLRAEHGFERAFELCSSDNREGEAFCRAWDEAQNDLSSGALVTVGDLVTMTSKARSGWLSKPREVLVVGVDGKEVKHALCPTPWFFN